jgi:hypothetical protein
VGGRVFSASVCSYRFVVCSYLLRGAEGHPPPGGWSHTPSAFTWGGLRTQCPGFRPRGSQKHGSFGAKCDPIVTAEVQATYIGRCDKLFRTERSAPDHDLEILVFLESRRVCWAMVASGMPPLGLVGLGRLGSKFYFFREEVKNTRVSILEILVFLDLGRWPLPNARRCHTDLLMCIVLLHLKRSVQQTLARETKIAEFCILQ